MFSKGRAKIWLAVALVLLLVAVVIAIEGTLAHKNSASARAGSSMLMGIQGVKRTQTVGTKTELRKTKKATGLKNLEQIEKALKSLEQIEKEQIPLFVTMNEAMFASSELYKAQQSGRGNIQRLTDDLSAKIPLAKAALARFRVLSDQEIAVINATTKNKDSVNVVNSTYGTWRAGVESLKVEPLSDAELKAREDAITENAASATKSGVTIAKGIDLKSLASEDKDVLKNNVVSDGKRVFSDMQSTIQGMMKTMKELMNNVKSGQPPIDMKLKKELQKSFEGIGKSLEGFMRGYGPFVQTVGGVVGEKVTVPKLPNIVNMMREFSPPSEGGRGDGGGGGGHSH